MFNRSYIHDHQGHPHYLSDDQISELQSQMKEVSSNDELIQIIKTLSDSTRARIFVLLHEVKEIAVTDISTVLNLTQSATSHALADLKKLNLVECSRCGQLMCYSLRPQSEEKQEMMNRIYQLLSLK